MQKLTLIILSIIIGTTVTASEITDDYLDIAKNYCAVGSYKSAISYLDKILRIEPNNKNAYDLKHGLEYIISGNKNSYITRNNRQLMQAEDYKLAGNLQGEINTLLAESNRGNYWATYFLGEHYLENENPAEALKYYEKSINQNVNFSQCNLKIAQCYFALGKLVQANGYLNQYLAFNPEDDYAYALRAKINFNQGLYSDAENDIITASALNEDITYKFLYGKILYERRNLRESRKVLSALTSDIKTAEIYKYIGLCDYELGDYNNALLNLDKAIILSDDDISLNNKYNEIKAILSQKKITE